MPRILSPCRSLAVVALLGLLGSPTFAQNAPPDIPGVIQVCAPVISEEYDGNRERWGQCVAAVKSFLDAIGTPSASTDATVGDLVIALTELYEDDVRNCKQVETELPQAILLASERVIDEDQKLQIIEISATIEDCAQFATAAITVEPSPSASGN